VRYPRGRFSMLETVREYALERLEERAEADDLGLRHAQFFLELAQDGEYELGERRRRWLERLEAEHDNLRAALSWCRAAGEHGLGLRLAAAVGRFWDFRGYLSEGRRWLEEALAAGPREPPAIRAKAMKVLFDIVEAQGEYSAAETGFRETLALYRRAGDKAGVARCLRKLGGVASRLGDEERGRALLEQAVDAAMDAGDPLAAGVACLNLGQLALSSGRHDEGRIFWERSRVLLRQIPMSDAAVSLLLSKSELALAHGDLEEATRLLAETVDASRAIGWQQGLVHAVDSLGALAAARGDARGAVVLLAAAERHAEAIGVRHDAEEIARRERLFGLRKALGDREFAAARDEGSALDVEGALARLPA
jgi:tetratricopeptide (TPR) repeat protein